MKHQTSSLPSSAHTLHSNMGKPFHGMHFCCTGLLSSHRQELERQIRALGGELHEDLMSSVNFLVVGGRKTEKYKYSVRYRHDISFVAPEAISEIHSRWLSGSDLSLDIHEHLLPVFSNMTICVARVEAPSSDTRRRLFSERFRQPPAQALPGIMPQDAFSGENLIETLSKLGADVSATLTPDCAVLIGTDSAGKRHRVAQEWHIPVAHPLWVYDSCLRGAALHLEDYELTPGRLNLYSSTSFAWKKLFLSRIGARNTDQGLVELRDRPLLKKSSAVWTSIMTSAHNHPIGPKQVTHSSWAEPDAASTTEDTSVTSADTPKVVSAELSSSSVLFSHKTFLPIGLSVPEQTILRRIVESHSGTVALAAEDERVTHIVLRVRDGPQAHMMLSMLPPIMKQRINRRAVRVVTDWFIERSVYYNSVRDDGWCRPLPGLVPSLKKFKVSLSGFTGVELLHLEKLVGLLHMELCSVFSASRDLLVVNVCLFEQTLSRTSPKLFEYSHQDILRCPVYKNGEGSSSVSDMSTKNKINAAKRWGIPVVSVAYLWEMVEISGSQPNLQLPDISDLSWCVFSPRSAPRPGSLLEFLRNEKSSEGTPMEPDSSEKQDSAGSNERVQLPSPRKSKDKQKYGRLVGGGESLTEKLLKSKEQGQSDHEQETREPDISINEDENLTQVGYGSADSAKGGNDLWDKLEDIDDRLPKRRRTRG